MSTLLCICTIPFSADSRECWNPRRSAVYEIFKPPRLAPTVIPRSKSLRSDFFPILTFVWKTAERLDYVCMLIKSLHLRAEVQVYLITCSVTVYAFFIQIGSSILWIFSHLELILPHKLHHEFHVCTYTLIHCLEEGLIQHGKPRLFVLFKSSLTPGSMTPIGSCHCELFLVN